MLSCIEVDQRPAGVVDLFIPPTLFPGALVSFLTPYFDDHVLISLYHRLWFLHLLVSTLMRCLCIMSLRVFLCCSLPQRCWQSCFVNNGNFHFACRVPSLHIHSSESYREREVGLPLYCHCHALCPSLAHCLCSLRTYLVGFSCIYSSFRSFIFSKYPSGPIRINPQPQVHSFQILTRWYEVSSVVLEYFANSRTAWQI